MTEKTWKFIYEDHFCKGTPKGIVTFSDMDLQVQMKNTSLVDEDQARRLFSFIPHAQIPEEFTVPQNFCSQMFWQQEKDRFEMMRKYWETRFGELLCAENGLTDSRRTSRCFESVKKILEMTGYLESLCSMVLDIGNVPNIDIYCLQREEHKKLDIDCLSRLCALGNISKGRDDGERKIAKSIGERRSSMLSNYDEGENTLVTRINGMIEDDSCSHKKKVILSHIRTLANTTYRYSQVGKEMTQTKEMIDEFLTSIESIEDPHETLVNECLERIRRKMFECAKTPKKGIIEGPNDGRRRTKRSVGGPLPRQPAQKKQKERTPVSECEVLIEMPSVETDTEEGGHKVVKPQLIMVTKEPPSNEEMVNIKQMKWDLIQAKAALEIIMGTTQQYPILSHIQDCISKATSALENNQPEVYYMMRAAIETASYLLTTQMNGNRVTFKMLKDRDAPKPPTLESPEQITIIGAPCSATPTTPKMIDESMVPCSSSVSSYSSSSTRVPNSVEESDSIESSPVVPLPKSRPTRRSSVQIKTRNSRKSVEQK